MTDYLHALRLFHRDVRLFLVTQASIGFCYFGIYAVLLNLYLLRLDYSLEFIGLVNAAGSLAFALSSLTAGLTGQRWGNRRMMIVGTGLSLTGFALLPLIDSDPVVSQPVWIVATYVLAWFGIAQFVVHGSPFLMASSSPEERNHVFSLTAAVLPLAALAGNLVAGLLPGIFATLLDLSLDQPEPYRYPLLIAPILLVPGMVSIMVTHKIGAGRPQETSDPEGPAPIALIALLTLVGLLQRTGDGSTRAFFNVYMDANLHVSTALIGMMSAASQLIAVLASLATPLLAARWGVGRTALMGVLGVGLSLLPMALIPHWSAAGFGFMMVTGLISITIPTYIMFNLQIVPPKWQTTVSGAGTMAVGLSWAGVALVGSYVVTALGYRSLFLMSSVLTIAGGLIFWACFRVPRGSRSGVRV